MKIVITSDTHFGDTNCVLSSTDSIYYKKFIDALNQNSDGSKYKYLIILGDSLDLAVANYYDAITAAKAFFTGIKDIFEKIIIIPGNHDHDLWTMLQFQDQIVNCNSPKQNLWTASAYLHNIGGDLLLQPNPAQGRPFHEGTFLDRIFPNSFIVASPNIYLADDEKTILLTHGQYFEYAWAFLADWTARAFGNDLNKIQMDGLQHILGDDFLSNQVICSGLGQSEINLVKIIQSLEHDFKEKKYGPIIKYIIEFILSYRKGMKLFEDIIENRQEIMTFLRYIFSSVLFTTRDHNDLDQLEKELRKELSNLLLPDFTILKNIQAMFATNKIWNRLDIMDSISHHKKTIRSANDADNNNAGWIKKYIDASNSDFNSQNLQYMIFGHTHHPVTWDEADSKIDPCPQNTTAIANCGGWLYKSAETNMCGANLFIYDSITRKITDVEIR